MHCFVGPISFLSLHHFEVAIIAYSIYIYLHWRFGLLLAVLQLRLNSQLKHI